jgi:hypothetical protein
MLFQFFRHQLQRERPTISSTVRRENGQMYIGGNTRVEMVDDVSSRSAPRVIIVEERAGSAAKKA